MFLNLFLHCHIKPLHLKNFQKKLILSTTGTTKYWNCMFAFFRIFRALCHILSYRKLWLEVERSFWLFSCLKNRDRWMIFLSLLMSGNIFKNPFSPKYEILWDFMHNLLKNTWISSTNPRPPIRAIFFELNDLP